MEDLVLREALFHLCIKAAARVSPVAISGIPFDLDSLTLITLPELRSQVIAAITALNPRRWIGKDLGRIPRSEASCSEEWLEVGRFVMKKLTKLSERRPQQTGRNIYRSLCRGWEKHLEDESRNMPEFDPRLDDDFEDYTNALFRAVTFFAQQSAKSYEGWLEGESFSDRMHRGAMYKVEQAINDHYGDDPAQASSTTTSKPTGSRPPLSADAEDLLRAATAAVKKHIITQNDSACKSIAYALVKCAANSNFDNNVLGELVEQEGPFSRVLLPRSARSAMR